jgi:hypothetical protein
MGWEYCKVMIGQGGTTSNINATSTCDSTFRAGFAGQCVRVSMVARVKAAQEQRLGAQVVEIPKLLESLRFWLIT